MAKSGAEKERILFLYTGNSCRSQMAAGFARHLKGDRIGAQSACITVCDRAVEHCPVFPGTATVIHIPFDDPPALAKSAASEDDPLTPCRRARDEIARFIETLPEALRK